MCSLIPILKPDRELFFSVHPPPPVAATSVRTEASPEDARITSAPGSQSQPVAATSARAEASSKEVRVAPAPGDQPVATSVGTEFS